MRGEESDVRKNWVKNSIELVSKRRDIFYKREKNVI
jgi:hypothetical protein